MDVAEHIAAIALLLGQQRHGEVVEQPSGRVPEAPQAPEQLHPAAAHPPAGAPVDEVADLPGTGAEALPPASTVRAPGLEGCGPAQAHEREAAAPGGADGRGREQVRNSSAAALLLQVASRGHPRGPPPLEVPQGSDRPVQVFCVEEGRAGSVPGPARAVSSGSVVPDRLGRGAFGAFAARRPEGLPRDAAKHHHRCGGIRS